jgi:hypothetical protein
MGTMTSMDDLPPMPGLSGPMGETSNNDIMTQLLNSTLNTNSAQQTAAAVKKDDYKKLVAFGNVTSYSMQSTLKACARKFQLMKMEADCNGPKVYEDNPDFAFGHAVGAGVATYDETQDLQKSLWACFLAWNIDLFAEKEKKFGPGSRSPNKSFHHAMWAIMCYETFYHEETDLAEYNVVKNESTVAVDFEDGNFYVGHIDTLLRNRNSGKFKVKENKTTVFATVDPALYSNSEQALSYALVVDSLGASEYDVLYTVYSTTEQRWMQFEFTKSPRAKAEWIQSQFFTNSNIELYSEHNFFPKNGASCISFGRRCEYYESCDFNSSNVFGKNFSGLPRAESFATLETVEPYDFKFKVSEILTQQKSNLESNQ